MVEDDRVEDDRVEDDRVEDDRVEDDRVAGAVTDRGSEPRATRLFDPGALVIGLWFVVVGLVAAVVGSDLLDDLPPVVIPVSFAVIGLALLVPKRRVADRDRPDW